MTLALSLFLCWLALSLVLRFKPQITLKSKVFVLVLVVPVVAYPFMYGPVWWLRGLTGDLSITSLFLLASALYQQLYGSYWMVKRDRKVLEWGIVCMGLFLYPLALGLGQFDPYVWGYHNFGFVVALLTIAALALWLNHKSIVWILVLGLFAWDMQLLQSVNLWDYIIDPFVFFFYVGRLVQRRIKGVNHAFV